MPTTAPLATITQQNTKREVLTHPLRPYCCCAFLARWAVSYFAYQSSTLAFWLMCHARQTAPPCGRIKQNRDTGEGREGEMGTHRPQSYDDVQPVSTDTFPRTHNRNRQAGLMQARLTQSTRTRELGQRNLPSRHKAGGGQRPRTRGRGRATYRNGQTGTDQNLLRGRHLLCQRVGSGGPRHGCLR